MSQSKSSFPRRRNTRPARIRWVIAIFVAVPLLLVGIQLWPVAFLSEGRCLTGQAVHFQEAFSARDPGREGYYVRVCRLSAADAQSLKRSRQTLAAYPMWSSGVAFDSYQQIKWQSPVEFESGPHAEVLTRAIYQSGHYIGPEVMQTKEDAMRLAAFLLCQDGVLLSGHHRGPANYTIYVLDLERGILVSINLCS